METEDIKKQYSDNNYSHINYQNYRKFIIANIQTEERDKLLNKLKLSSNKKAREWALIIEDSGKNYICCKNLAKKYNKKYKMIRLLINKWNKHLNKFKQYIDT